MAGEQQQGSGVGEPGPPPATLQGSRGDGARADELTADPALPAAEAGRLMRDRNVRHLLVVDRDGRPAGVVHRADLLALVLRRTRRSGRASKTCWRAGCALAPTTPALPELAAPHTAQEFVRKRNGAQADQMHAKRPSPGGEIPIPPLRRLFIHTPSSCSEPVSSLLLGPFPHEDGAGSRRGREWPASDRPAPALPGDAMAACLGQGDPGLDVIGQRSDQHVASVTDDCSWSALRPAWALRL